MAAWTPSRGTSAWQDARWWGLVGLLALIVVFDLRVSTVFTLPMLLLPVVLSVFFAGPGPTAVLAAAASVIAVASLVMNDYFARTNGLVWIIVVIIVGALAVLMSALRENALAANDISERRREASEERYRVLAENATDVVSQSDLHGAIVWVSPSVQDLLGVPADALVGHAIGEFIHPDDVAVARARLEPVAAGEAVDYEVRFRVASGEYRWVALRTRPIRDDSGRVVGRVTGWRDIDVEHRARQALQASEVRYRLLAQNAMDLVFSLDVSAIIQWVSPSVTALLEYEPAELIGQFGAVLLHPDDLPILLDAATEARAGRPASCRIRMRSKSGQDRWVEATPRAIFDDERVIVGGVIGVRDIHDEVLTAQALEHEVAFDGLTGLAKRTLALERIQEILDTRKSPGWALLCVGVNGLTAVNQAFTYAAGDDVLRTVAKRLVQAAGAADRVARITGDEFVVMLRDVITSTDAGNAAERLLAATRGPVGVVDERFNVTCSVGIAVADGHDAQALLRDATAAMRQASSKGGDRWELLGADVAAETRHALSVQAALREALAVGEIEAWYMPIADIHDARVHGFEALVRWVHPDGTVTGPAEFLEIAERSNLIIAIDRLMIAKASLELAALPPDQHIAVNVSAATLSSGILEAAVRDALATTGVNPTRLHIEVTETALLDVTETMTHTMGSLAAFGISWWVDDFGTGFSSISHLRDLPVTGLKLDRSFTAGITKHDDHVARLTQGLAGLANGLRLATVAEGVETQEQASILAGQGWQLGQGWLYGRPQPMSAFR